MCLSCPSLLLGLEARVLPAVSTRLGTTVLPAVQAVLVDVAALERTRDPRVANKLHADVGQQIVAIGEALRGVDGRVVTSASKADAPAAAALDKALGAATAGHVDESLAAFAAASAALAR